MEEIDQELFFIWIIELYHKIPKNIYLAADNKLTFNSVENKKCKKAEDWKIFQVPLKQKEKLGNYRLVSTIINSQKYSQCIIK